MAKFDSAVATAAKHFQAKMPERVRSLLSGCLMDVHNGPVTKADAEAHNIEKWPGYESALETVEDWWHGEGEGSDVWVDTDADYVSTTEPEHGEDICSLCGMAKYVAHVEDHCDHVWVFEEHTMGEWVHLSRKQVAKELFGVLITDGGMSA